MATLLFNNNKSLKSLARETLKASEFRVPYENKTTDEKGFFLVKDEGIYLMNAFSADNGKTPKQNGFVVYASGFNPKYDKDGDLWDRTYAVSRDDFAQNIPIEISQLNRLREDGKLTIKLTDEYIEVEA